MTDSTDRQANFVVLDFQDGGRSYRIPVVHDPDDREVYATILADDGSPLFVTFEELRRLADELWRKQIAMFGEVPA